jgi:RND superfamily putative drug exporter
LYRSPTAEEATMTDHRPGPPHDRRRRRARFALATWAIVVGVLALLGHGIEERLAPMSLAVPGTPSADAAAALHERFGDSVPIAVLLEGPPAALDRQGPRLVAALRRTGDARVLSPWGERGAARTLRALRPRPGAALVAIDFARPEQEAMTKVVPLAERIVEQQISAPVDAHVSGLPVIGRAIRDASLHATRRAELIALPALVLVLLLVFRSPIAAAVPLAMGAATVMAGRGLLSLATAIAPINSLGVAIASMMGLALGVDYALLMVSRYRQERERGAGHEPAVDAAARIAGRTIVFAGGTLAVAMATAALLAPGGLLGSVAAGVVVSGLLSVLLAISAIPALLELAGPHLERWRLPSPRGRGGRLLAASERLGARPAVAIPLVLLVVLALARPALGLQMGPPDVRQLPASDPARQSFEAVQRAVGPGWAAPFVVVATARDGVISDPRRLRAIVRWEQRMARAPGVAAVIGPGSFGGERELAQARRDYRSAPERIADAERSLRDLRRGLRRASGGVAALRAGLRAAADGARRLGDGARRGQAGAGRLEDGLAHAAAGSRRLSEGLDASLAGANRLVAGQRRLTSGADQLAGGMRTLDVAAQASLGQMRTLSGQLRDWAEAIRALRAPTQLAAARLDAALRELEAMTVGRQDPRYAALLAAVQDASGAMTGDPSALPPGAVPDAGALGAAARGVLPALDRLEEQLASSVEGLAAMTDGAAQLADGIGQLRDGADRLAVGTRDAERGTIHLRDGLRRLAAGSHRLDRGVRRLHGGAGGLAHGLDAVAGGADTLARSLADGDGRAGPLEHGLAEPDRPLARYATVLHGYGDAYRDFDARSPGAASSGYLLLTVLDGTVPGVRDQIAQAVNLDSGGQAARILVVSRSAPSTPGTERLSDRLRREAPVLAATSASDVAVGEGAQSLLDYRDATIARFPWLIAALAAVAALMLVLVLRALLLSLVAVALNLATIAAAFGALQLMFGLNLFEGPRTIDAVSAAGVFAIMFVLAIDYEVFLLTRMREAWIAHHDHEAAIADGLRSTASVIAGAAVIMSAVFLAFAASGLASLSQFGAGLTVAVLLDATVVRLLLLPAIMRAIGPRVWWLPAWLERRLPGIEHAEAPAPPAPVPAPAVLTPEPDPDPAPAPASPIARLGAVADEEHAHLFALLREIEEAGVRRDGARVTDLVHALRDAAEPHFRYEQRALFPQLVDAIGPERVERLYAEQDSVVAALAQIESLAGRGRLGEREADATIRLVRAARASVAACDGLGGVVAGQPAEVAERVLEARARVLGAAPAPV